MTATDTAAPFRAANAKTGKEIRLAMQSLWLTGRVLPVGARLMVRHAFCSAEKKPVEVVYAFALPRDGALRRFRINGEGFSVRSDLRTVEEAAAAYERGLEAGHLAALAREHADGVVNLTVGNIRPGETVTVMLEILAGVELRDGGLRFRFPFTLAPTYHRQARAIEAEPGVGELELPEEGFGDVLLPRWLRDAGHLHGVGFDLAVAVPGEIEEIASPSHALRVAGRRVSLAVAKDVPDRDLVLDVRAPASGVIAGRDREGKVRLAAVVPSTRFGVADQAARRVVFVLDRSGSMEGAAIEQARRATAACVAALEARDRFGLIAFDNDVEAFRPALAEAGAEERRAAREFLEGIDARGGTELVQALEHAAGLLGPDGGDAVVFTDGQVSGTGEIVARARRTGMRIHCLGIGSASQDRFLALLARETGGVSHFATPRERVDLAAVDLFASAGRPLAENLTVTGAAVAPAPPAAVFAGTPLVLFGEADGPGTLGIRWPGGELALDFTVEPAPAGETLRLLQGARLIADLEAREPAGKREEARIARRLEALGREFGLANRRMALVAVLERAGDRPGDVPKTVVVPVGMPQDTAFGAYFATAMVPAAPMVASAAPLPRIRACFDMAVTSFRSEPAPPPVMEDRLMELAGRMEPDGGMPGPNAEARAAATAAALLAFLSAGHTPDAGPFRLHMQRLAAFLGGLAPAPLKQAVLDRVDAGRAVPGAWLDDAAALADGALAPAEFWRRLSAAL